MNNVTSRAAAKQNSSRKRRKLWQRAVRVLAVFVVFCTTYALILPAITMQSTAICGKEVHKHTEECYEMKQSPDFDCGIPDDAVVLHQHDVICYGDQEELICTLTELAEHVHGDGCYTESQVLNCPVTHVHGEACATVTKELCCTVTEEGHVHAEECYQESTVYCSEPTAEDHVHESACYQTTKELGCGKEEIRLHAHEAACFDGEGNLICSLPVVISHIHTEDCLNRNENAEKKLVCSKEEHEHTDICYPLEEDAVLGTEYHCGFTAHVCDEHCYAPDGTKTCTIPEHTHDTLCLISDLDLEADLETKDQWEATLKDVELTGIWADDLIAVAESQLGYMESKKNCILYQDELLGYTRYGAWYGNAYGKWDDMFVSFCLNYAKIDEESVPRESDTVRWITALTEKELYVEADGAVPVPGDLVFMDTNEDEKADFAGIVTELLPEDEIRIIAGDTETNSVTYLTCKLAGDGVLGYGKLPENPEPETGEESDVTAMLAALPEAAALQDSLNTFQSAGDKTGFENTLKDLMIQLEAIETKYNELSAEEKALVVGTEKITALLEVCTNVTWQDIPALTMDGAMISGLTETASEILSKQTKAEGELPILHNQDAVTWQFTAETKAHDGESTFSSARVKVELVLPLTADKAVFDTSAMTWLEDSKLTVETRTIGENRVNCQLLTGVKNLTPADGSFVVIPGSFTETVKVNVLNAAHGDQVFVQISAAMEQNDWNGTCWLHQVEEKQIITTSAFAVSNPMDPDDQQANYESFKASIQALMDQNFPLEQSVEIADQVQDDLDAAYVAGMLSYDLYYDLSMMVIQNLGDPNTIAEAAIGNFWKNEVATPKQNYTPKTEPEIPVWQPTEAASTFRLRRAADNRQQINEYGGESSADNAVFVSKEISPTAQENVFDIELNIVTRDRIETVYKEPDMAVVIVTDISNTMNTKFKNESDTRYEAAMDSAEEFLNRFQQEAGQVSQIGYVAFNTHGHKIFDLQTCDTPEKAQQLADEMRAETKAIVKANGYAGSEARFTNIEAGLKMAWHMLEDAPNRNKFIVFLSDGFPTTYLKNHGDASTNYNGYHPNSSRGTIGAEGVFYDNIRNKWCSAGTNYSDTGAIYAREMAKKIKADGIDIFSIGVDIGGQTIKGHFDATANTSYSFVEYPKNNYPTDYRFEIGIWDNANSFKNWLKGSKTSGIGSGEGYYYDSSNTAGLHDAYDAIFEKIKILNGASTHTDWVVSDPMPGLEVSELKNIEFINFWDGSELVASLKGEQQADGMYDNNTATFDPATNTITWNLKESIYYVVSDMGDYRNYMFNLRYRVRLENENTAFIENKAYNTNDPTSLTYRLIEVKDEVTVIGEQKKLPFEIPVVHGYLSELNFLKVDPLKNPVSGAEFTLSHDTESCGACRGDGETSVRLDNYFAVSDNVGHVRFARIPSGHTYTLTETKVPDGYTGTLNTYQVQVAYDNLIVTVTDSSGNVLEWDETVENGLFYELPITGGSGTSHFTFGGFALIGAAALMYICMSGHKRKRGGAYRNR